MEVELDNIVMCCKDGTVINNGINFTALDNDTDDEKTIAFLSNFKDFEISFDDTYINEDILYQLGVIHWYNWWNTEYIEVMFK